VTFSEDVIGVHDALDAAQVTHGFGGALALGFYAEPRLTADIDVNVFRRSRRASGPSPSAPSAVSFRS
jgi:hypothetical protein